MTGVHISLSFNPNSFISIYLSLFIFINQSIYLHLDICVGVCVKERERGRERERELYFYRLFHYELPVRILHSFQNRRLIIIMEHPTIWMNTGFRCSGTQWQSNALKLQVYKCNLLAITVKLTPTFTVDFFFFLLFFFFPFFLFFLKLIHWKTSFRYTTSG